MVGPTGVEVFGSRKEIVLEMIERGGQKGFWYKALECVWINYSVTNEIQTFDTAWFDYIELDGETSLIGRNTQWAIDGATVVRPVVVTNDIGTITYVENTDYTLNTSLGTITRIPAVSGGDIPINGTISVSYDWKQKCIETRTGQPRKNCPHCRGLGMYYGSHPIELIGIMTIPTYKDTFERAGVWQTGDMTYSVPIDYLLKAGESQTTNFHIKDKLVITGRDNVDAVWYVVDSPTTIQLGNEYLCAQCHIRLMTNDYSVNI